MKSKLLLWIIVGVLSTVCVTAGVIGVVVNNKKDNTPPNTHEHVYASEWSYDETCHWHGATCSHTNEKIDVEEHTTVIGYDISEGADAETAVKTQSRCVICGWLSDETTLGTDEYNVIKDDEIASNSCTISETGIYVLEGKFSGTTFTIDAEDVSLVGIGAETSNVRVSFSSNAKDTLLYGLKWALNSPGTISMNIYGNVSFVKCEFSNFYITLKNADINLIFDNNMVVGGDYGVYVGYNEETNKPTGYFTNNTFDAIGVYGIFFNSDYDNAEIVELVIKGNSFINGWGQGDVEKRAAIKLNEDKNLTPEDYGDTKDTSKLTDDARAFVREVLKNNTFDKAGKICSYFNLRGIYFDTID